MSILISSVRVHGLRGLRNVEVLLEPITVLTGMNNSGKTSLLKALQIALGNRQFISHDDFYVSGNTSAEEIIVDLKIVPIDDGGTIGDVFEEDWETVFTTERIRQDNEGNSFIPLRTVVTFDKLRSTYRTAQYILPKWPDFNDWYQSSHVKNVKETPFHFDALPFFFVDAQRDILEDMKLKTSYLGRMLSKIEYEPEEIKKIEKQIKELNDKAVSCSPILSNIKNTLKELNTAMDTTAESVEITPFTKKIRDLNKGISIYYKDNKDSFSMEYHGMGTRSWSSLLTLKAFITLLRDNAAREQTPYFPILAIEEPEAHLHPNAKKKLFSQIKDTPGQKIISTHSPYIAACAELEEIRGFYRDDNDLCCGSIDMSQLETEEIRKIRRQVINTRGEVFFSKAVILFEGETEEQALPIFAEHYFKSNPAEMEINFIGVGGSGGYAPFIRITENLNIPWFILSDGEEQTKDGLGKSLKKCLGREIDIDTENNLFVLDDGCDFERYLLNCGYKKEIISGIKKAQTTDYLKKYIRNRHGTNRRPQRTEEVCDKCNQNIFEGPKIDYHGRKGLVEALYDCMTSQNNKTRCAPDIAREIVKKDIPPIIQKMFEEVEKVLKVSDDRSTDD